MNSINIGTVAPAKVMEKKVDGFRWLVKEDGTKVLQVLCPWSKGQSAGCDWLDVPEVKE